MDIIIKIIYLLLLIPVCFLLVPALKNSRGMRWFIIVIHAFLLTLLSILFFNDAHWRWAEMTDLSPGFKQEDSAAYRFIEENFILVDNAFDKTLLPNPDGDEDDSTSLVITNRATLTSFLHLVNENRELVDMLVCDIGFENATPNDSLLGKEMQELYGEDKLMLARATGDTKNSLFTFGKHSLGHVTEESSNGSYVSHQIMQDGYYSMPYKLYSIIDSIPTATPFFFTRLLVEKNNKGKTSISANTFIPAFSLLNHKKLLGKDLQTTGGDINKPVYESGERLQQSYYYLSSPLSDNGKSFFTENLRLRKRQGHKNIIFIGSFDSPYEDIYQTMHGKLHGPAIILNILYSLHTGAHHISAWLLLSLFFGYILVTWVLVGSSLKIFRPNKKNPVITATRLKHKTGSFTLLKGTFVAVLKFLVEEVHFLLLLGMVLVIQYCFGYIVNAMSLLLHFTVVSLALKYAYEHAEESLDKSEDQRSETKD